jgi:uncharacterized tellurite resistance protein B-like protein
MELIILLICAYLVYRHIKSKYQKKRAPRASPYPQPSHRQQSRPKRQDKAIRVKWHGAGQAVNIKNYSIPGGLIYVETYYPGATGYENDACLINPELKVSPAEPWQFGEEMGYCPSYTTISPSCRGAYLKWLATGRSEPEAYIGYVFLFFYGLERRIFYDRQKRPASSEEREAISNEVRRLLSIYGRNSSFRGYAGKFLSMEYIISQEQLNPPESIITADRYSPELTQFVLACKAAGQEPVSAPVALQWLSLHPDFGFRAPARRCPKEFEKLFRRRYEQRFGNGLIIKPNKTRLSLSYRFADPSLGGIMEYKRHDLPDPFVLTGPLKKINDVAEECADDLDAYSRHLGRKDNSADSWAAQALLPADLLEQSENIRSFRSWLSNKTKSGLQLTPLKELYKALGDDALNPITKKEAETMAVFCEKLGYGIIPDVRYYGQKMERGGGIVIFPKGHGLDFKPSDSFLLASVFIRLGALVSQSDGDVSPHEESFLKDFIESSRDLTSIEKDSLMAYLYWSLHAPQGPAGLKQKLSELDESGRKAVSRVLLAVAQADGKIDPKEVKQLEKLYASLGLDKNQVIGDLHAMASDAGPVTVAPGEPAPTYAIPAFKSDLSSGLSLNEELIRLREKETSQVRSVLEHVFADPQDDEPVEIVESSSLPEHGLSGLDESHAALFRKLMSQAHWERSSLREICNQYNLMLDGALEIINEWAFEQANAPLIEDGDPVFFDIDLAKEILDGNC